MAKKWSKWQKFVQYGQKLSKWPKNVKNGQNPTRIKLILPGKKRTGSTSADPLKIGPPEPPCFRWL